MQRSQIKNSNMLSARQFAVLFCISVPSLAFADSVVRCSDGVFREASACPRNSAAAAQANPPPRAATCNPAGRGYAECVRTLNDYRAERARQDAADRRQLQADADREREGRFWNRLSGNCDFLQGQTQRDECSRDQRNSRLHERNLRDQAEAERQARMRALQR
jgi:hypothetical protein